MATRKQLAARALFAKRARAGTLRRGKRKKSSTKRKKTVRRVRATRRVSRSRVTRRRRSTTMARRRIKRRTKRGLNVKTALKKLAVGAGFSAIFGSPVLGAGAGFLTGGGLPAVAGAVLAPQLSSIGQQLGNSVIGLSGGLIPVLGNGGTGGGGRTVVA